VRAQIAVINPRTGASSEELTVRADTGATLTVIPGTVRAAPGVHRRRRLSRGRADGRHASRDVGDARVAVNGASVPCRVLSGEPGETHLRGLTGPEPIGLAVDPVRRRPIPTDCLLH